jgi:hypothetical protein
MVEASAHATTGVSFREGVSRSVNGTIDDFRVVPESNEASTSSKLMLIVSIGGTEMLLALRDATMDAATDLLVSAASSRSTASASIAHVPVIAGLPHVPHPSSGRAVSLAAAPNEKRKRCA